MPGSAEAGGFRLLDQLYRDEAMRVIWSAETTVSGWLRVEAALARAQADAGLLSVADADQIERACVLETVDLDELWRSARNVGYPILGLVRQVARRLPAGPNGRVHYGATTQDIMDTALSLQLVSALERLEVLAVAMGDGLAELTTKHAGTVMAARTHGQQAVPTTFGAKAAVFLHQIGRLSSMLRRTRAEVAVVSLFGAGGTNAAMAPVGPAVRARLADRLGLACTDVPWHVARDGVVRAGQAAALGAGLCARLAREVIDLSRSEIGELAEADGHHRGASSTMPQKANPITAESIVGFAVAATTTSQGLYRGLEAGHERSAGEWQVEWLLLPETMERTASAMALSADMVATLRVDPAAMERNLHADGGLLMAEALMMRLAPVLGREEAHELVYTAARLSRRSSRPLAAEAGDLLRARGESDTPAELSPADYLGEAAAVCAAAVRSWEQLRDSAAAEPDSTPDLEAMS